MADLEYLEEERRKLWEKTIKLEDRIRSLEEEIDKKSSDYEKEAKHDSKKASEYRNRSKEARDIILNLLEEANLKMEEIKSVHQHLVDFQNQIIPSGAHITDIITKINNINTEVEQRVANINRNVDSFEKLFAEHDTFVENLSDLESIYTRSDDYSAKINSLYNSISNKKKEIESLHYQIIGYSDKDETTGEITKVEGLRDTLESSYDEIKEKLAELEKEFGNIKTVINNEFKKESEAKENQFKVAFNRWQTEYKSVLDKIQDLLPNALTAGLSHAYSAKKSAELSEYAKYESTFKRAIAGLITVSLIPFGISVFSLFHNDDFENVLMRVPRLVLAILPIYVPVLWVAHSASKKMSLSKRLTEEYTHKEVLSKTFEGLSKQISDVEKTDLSSDLKIKLLYNILEVSSENPGKLITDYNKSDHPLIDALDKSVKLANAVDKLSQIPGFTKLATVIQKKSNDLIEEKMLQANKGLEIAMNQKNNTDEE